MDNGVKEYKSYDEQVDLLSQRGMDVGDRDAALTTLQRVNYYRLSGYWYPFRKKSNRGRDDEFSPGTRLSDVIALYDFDDRLRTATFAVLTPLELAFRALLGHELGRVDPCAHLDPDLLGPTARIKGDYGDWLVKYERKLAQSREDFVSHYRAKYGGVLPVWAAVEIMDWGGLTWLYSFSPFDVQDTIADMCGLTAPQLTSWLKALNLLRNTCAHHGRLFNRVHTLSPKLPQLGQHPDLDAVATDWSRTFGQLTMIQYLLDRLQVGRPTFLPTVLKTFPSVQAVPITDMGASSDWSITSPLWNR